MLRENGYECDYGVLYYAETKTRITIELTQELIERTLQLLIEARATSASGQIPPPLIDSPKCPRCSLVGICLPDEVNLLRSTSGHSTVIEVGEEIGAPETLANSEPRRLMPARDDALAVYVQGQGYSVGLKGEVLEIREKGKVVRQAGCWKHLS